MTDQIFVGGASANMSAAAARFHYLDGGGTWVTAEFGRSNLITSAGTLSHLRVELASAPGAGTSIAFEVMLNGVAQSLAVTIADAATSGEDTSNTVAVSAGDRICLRATPTGTPAVSLARWASQYAVTASSTAVWGSSGATLPSNGAVRYNHIGGCGAPNWEATQTNRDAVWNIDGTITNFYVRLSGAPGASKSWEFAIMKNGAAEASSVITIADAATTANVTGLTIDIAPGDKLSLRSTPTNTPGAPNVQWGIAYGTDVDKSWNVSGLDELDPVGAQFHFLNTYSSLDWDGTETNRLGMGGAATGFTAYAFKSLRLDLSTAPGAGDTRTWMLRVNQADSALSTTIADAATTAVSTGSVTIAAGDKVDVGHTSTGTPSSGAVFRWAMLAGPPAAAASSVRHLALLGVGT